MRTCTRAPRAWSSASSSSCSSRPRWPTCVACVAGSPPRPVRRSSHARRQVLDGTIAHRREVLGRVALQVEAWSRRVKKEKAVYHALNMFNYDITHKALMAEAWIPESDIGRANEALRRAAVRAPSLSPCPRSPRADGAATGGGARAGAVADGGGGDARDAAHVLPVRALHEVVPGHDRLVRRRALPGGQPLCAPPFRVCVCVAVCVADTPQRSSRR
jgi:hypothetical protein